MICFNSKFVWISSNKCDFVIHDATYFVLYLVKIHFSNEYRLILLGTHFQISWIKNDVTNLNTTGLKLIFVSNVRIDIFECDQSQERYYVLSLIAIVLRSFRHFIILRLCLSPSFSININPSLIGYLLGVVCLFLRVLNLISTFYDYSGSTILCGCFLRFIGIYFSC